VIDSLRGRAPHDHLIRIGSSLGDAEAFGHDLQLALHICYELHYRGFAGVDPRWEWDPALLHLRGRMEEIFLNAMRDEVGQISPGHTAAEEMELLSTEPVDATGATFHLRDTGSWDQMREYFVHRSLYHLKEGDPHAWVIPRLIGQAKASFVAVEYDEYGAGRGTRLHQKLFGDLLDAAGLDSTYLGYIDVVVGESLAVVNLMSMLGLHRSLRGSAIGHFAATEITSPPGSRRLVAALKRIGAPDPCVHFYAEHVEADAVHEQVVRSGVVDDLLAREPRLERDVVFGMRAFGVVEDRLADHIMNSWTIGQSSLLRPLP
jgi:hypothetical protein